MKFLDGLPQNKNTEIHICFGNTNSKAGREHLMKVNCLWPILIAKRAMAREKRVISYGSALESFGIDNDYFSSKREFDTQLKQIKVNYLSTAIKLHTLYSDARPHPHMFLGQVYLSIRDNMPLNMTSGRQLREFHYVDDVIQSLDNALRNETLVDLEISHGKPNRLIQVAEYLLDSFKLRNLLNIATLPEPVNDNYNKIFEPTPDFTRLLYREPLSKIHEIFAKLLASEKKV
jgi:nucleoside-diphosphate-sugar epimerase